MWLWAHTTIPYARLTRDFHFSDKVPTLIRLCVAALALALRVKKLMTRFGCVSERVFVPLAQQVKRNRADYYDTCAYQSSPADTLVVPHAAIAAAAISAIAPTPLIQILHSIFASCVGAASVMRGAAR
jgi:hypothetical protein